jgi:hypothetical protein
MEVESAGGARYGAGITDDCTRYRWNMNLKKRSDFPKAFMEWAALVENETGCKIKRLRSDGAGENTSDEFVDWLRSKGIRHEVPPAHTSELNAVAERSHRTLVEYARAMLHEADFPSRWWAEALNTAVYLRNRSPTARLGATTPFEAYKGRKPYLAHLRVFGSQAWVHVPKENRKKLDNKAVEIMLMGYGETSSLYRILLNGKVKLYRDVRFNELHPAQGVVHLPIGIEQESAHPLHAVPQPDGSAQPLSQDPMQFATPQSLPPRQYSHASENPSRQYGRHDTVDEDTSEATYESAEEGEESDKSSAHSSGYKQRSKGPPPPREPSRRERRAPQRFDEEFNYFETFLSCAEPRNYKEAVATADAA